MRQFSTAQVARLVGIDKSTLLRWLYAGRLPEPKHVNCAGQELRVWTKSDLDAARRYKEKNYRKGRGRKKAN